MPSKLQIAVVYHSAAAYREPLFRCLFGHDAGQLEYTLFSGTSSNATSIRLMESSLADKPTSEGGLRWRLIRNFWIGQCLLQPYVLLLPWQKRWDCVIFLGNAYYLTTWLSALLCRLRGKKVLMWTHGYRTKPKSRVKRWFKNSFYKLADGLVLYGERAKSILIEEGFKAEQLFVAYNSAPGVPRSNPAADVSTISHLPKFKHPAPTLIWVGRMTPAKELPLLVEAVKRLHEAGTLCNVILIGEGPDHARISHLVTTNQLNDFFLLPGAVHDTRQLAAYLNLAQVAVSPGAIGLFAILAHGYGLPVVTHDDFTTQGPEAEIIVAGQTGSFFAEGDADAFAEALRLWLESPERCLSAAAMCRERVSRCYNPEYQIAVLREAVLSVCVDETKA
jgi:glycosyltransferase involved in cell wall biosynthesis